METSQILPSNLEATLSEIGERLETGKSIAVQLPAAIDGLASLPPRAISKAAPAIAKIAKLRRWRMKPPLFEAIFRRRWSDKEQLLRLLQRLSGGLPSPFLFAAVAWRLNDWVDPVRAAALACARRCFPATSADVIAKAAVALLPRQYSWGRWDDERGVLDAAYAREDVAARLADLLVDGSTGPGSRILRHLLRYDSIDPHLERLATAAAQPSVRSLAVQCLADRRATWQVGTMWKWVDKSMGSKIRVPRFEGRPLKSVELTTDVVKAATADKSAVVRKAGLDALIRHELGSNEAQATALRLSHDRSRAVRERAEFILSRAAPE